MAQKVKKDKGRATRPGRRAGEPHGRRPQLYVQKSETSTALELVCMPVAKRKKKNLYP